MKYCHSRFFLRQLRANRILWWTEDGERVPAPYTLDKGERIEVDDGIPDGRYYMADEPEAKASQARFLHWG